MSTIFHCVNDHGYDMLMSPNKDKTSTKVILYVRLNSVVEYFIEIPPVYVVHNSLYQKCIREKGGALKL